ncbi:MFS transporter [Muricoccus radiodurans]|uniref:MFS transporter n=1 Tax=Muricoccus radiodurans TaxID=2231721 RepID=UPI003CF5A2A5
MPPALLWLALGTFAVGTGTFTLSGLLPPIAADLGVGVPAAGHLILAYALTYALASPVLAAATAGFERRRTLTLAMATYVVASLAGAFAPNYAAVMATRIVAALAAALFVPAAGAAALALVPPPMHGRALALVVGGLTMSTVLGAPLGTLIGDRFGWRAAFVAVAILAALSAAGILLALPRLAGSRAASLRDRLSVAGRPAVLALLLQTVVTFAGAFSLFAYLAPFLQTLLGFGGQGTALGLLLSGLGGLLGVTIGGWAADRTDPRRFLILSTAILAATVIGISLAVEGLAPATAAPVVMGLLVVMGAAGWCFPPVQQARLVALEPPLAPVLLSLNAAATYFGTSGGALVGSLVIGAGGLRELGFAAGALAAIGALLIWRAGIGRRLALA